jgi:hypothetical protein
MEDFIDWIHFLVGLVTEATGGWKEEAFNFYIGSNMTKQKIFFHFM